MLHREAFRKSQSQPQPISNDTTAEQLVKESRCPLPPPLENDIRVMAKNVGLTYCEQVEKALGEWTEYKKLESECAAQEILVWLKVKIVNTLGESIATLFLLLSRWHKYIQ
jgi:hypothetical protein